MLDISNDYIAFDYVGNFKKLEEVLPYKQYDSGAKDADNPVYKDNSKQNSNPVLLLEFDILNKEGFGLKKGFYEIRPDEDFTCLNFIQSGKIAAKIPVIHHELISKYGNDYEWPDKKDKKDKSAPPPRLSEANDIISPEKITPVLTEKQKRKRDYKYKKGLDPIEYIRSSVKMEYDKELKLYVVIWEKYNTRLTGVLKTE